MDASNMMEGAGRNNPLIHTLAIMVAWSCDVAERQRVKGKWGQNRV
jgi:hypothetical protein